LEKGGVITGYGPDIGLAAAGYPVLAFVTLEIAQGGLAEVAAELERIPAVLGAHATTGTGDLHCQVAATSHEGLQKALLAINRIPGVVRSTSVIALSEVVAPRYLPLLESEQRPEPSRVPAYRGGQPDRAEEPGSV
jgi:DNA-binding Lrp family transcriptional regulator